MGDRGATGGAWGARDDASWWQGGAGEIQHQQQQINEEIVRSTSSTTQPHQLYTYKMTGNFSNNGGENTSNFDYRIISNPNNREESNQQQWWYSSGSVQPQQSASPTHTQSSPDPEGSDQGNNIQQSHQSLQHQQEQNQALQQQNQLQQQLQQQNLQQVLQQQSQTLQQTLQQSQQQSIQQSLQQHQQNQQQSQQSQQQQNQQQSQQQSIQQTLQQTQTLQQMLQQGQLQQSLQQTLQVSQAQAQAIVAQAALQQQVAQSLQQHTLHDHLQAVQQQQIQAALQRQTAKFQELQQQAQQQALIAQANNKVRMPRARAYNKPRGRMTAYAFFVQTCREEHKKKHPDENVVFAAFSKKCAERWNTMLEKEKQRFHEMAEQDKKRYDHEMQSYVPPKDVKVGRGRKRHQLKDPNAPKRSLSAFFWFCNDERSKVKANNPEYTMGDIAKELGRRWASADIEVKSKYEALSEQDKARYDREMTAYKKGPLALAQQPIPPPEVEEDVHDYDVEDC